jgi:membrane fusion protein
MPVLFRREAIEARQFSGFGNVVLRQPRAFGAWSAIAVVLAAAVLALLLFGQYTKRVRVHGITVPAAGVLKLMAPQAGIVVERRVDEGGHVRAGQTLFVLSSERFSEGGTGGSQSAILQQLEWRRASLADELARRMRLFDEQSEATGRRLAALQREAAQLDKELATQAAREASAAAQAATFDALAQQRFVSPLSARQRHDDRLEQTARRQALERSRLAVQRDIGAAVAELRQLPLRDAQQRAELQRDMSALQQEIAVVAAARRVVVTAPQDGQVTAIVAELGQAVGVQPLATLLPADAPLEAHLFAPSRAVGFVRPGQPVRVRYAAYPYQKFGQYDGRVTHVARAALAPGELAPPLAPPVQGEPLYRITVRLAQPHVMAYGQAQPLTAGMQLEADVLQDRRRLIEWVFEPLIALGRTL